MARLRKLAGNTFPMGSSSGIDRLICQPSVCALLSLRCGQMTPLLDLCSSFSRYETAGVIQVFHVR